MAAMVNQQSNTDLGLAVKPQTWPEWNGCWVLPSVCPRLGPTKMASRVNQLSDNRLGFVFLAPESTPWLTLDLTLCIQPLVSSSYPTQT